MYISYFFFQKVGGALPPAPPPARALIWQLSVTNFRWILVGVFVCVAINQYL